jgi:AcrR family transcriptional regulator
MKNTERSALTRARLLAVSRNLFALHGYAATSTDSILEAAGVRRGAMYHHYADKTALFEAVCIGLNEESVAAIEKATQKLTDPLEALIEGSIAWVQSTTRPDAHRILLLDAPTVLGWERWNAIDQRHGYLLLREGLNQALAAKVIHFEASLELLATMVNGALNALALRIASQSPGPRRPQWHSAIRALYASLIRR